MAIHPREVVAVFVMAGLCAAPTLAQNKTGASADYTRHGDSSRQRLQIRWQTPAVLVRKQTRALPLQKALEELRGKDPRPLLIQREAETSHKKRDDRVIRYLQGEEIRLLTHWFHCIRVGRKVLDPKHPYHALFAGKRPAQVLVVTWDGKTMKSLHGGEKERTTIGAVVAIAKLEYRKDPLAAIKQWSKLLLQWDKLDTEAEEWEARLAKAIDKQGDRSANARKWRRRLDSQPRARAALAKKEKKLQDLGLRHDPKARTYIDFEAEAAAAVKARSGQSQLDRLKKKLEKQKKNGTPDRDG